MLTLRARIASIVILSRSEPGGLEAPTESVDWGLVTAAVTETEDWGLVTDTPAASSEDFES